MQPLKIVLNVVPPSASKQSRSYSKRGISFPNKALVKARNIYSQLADFRPDVPLEGPLSLRILFVRPLAQSDLSTRAKRSLLESVHESVMRCIWCMSKPDVDNAASVLLDGLQTCGFFADDKQIVELRVMKVRAHKPQIVIEIESARDAATFEIPDGVW